MINEIIYSLITNYLFQAPTLKHKIVFIHENQLYQSDYEELSYFNLVSDTTITQLLFFGFFIMTIGFLGLFVFSNNFIMTLVFGEMVLVGVLLCMLPVFFLNNFSYFLTAYIVIFLSIFAVESAIGLILILKINESKNSVSYSALSRFRD